MHPTVLLYWLATPQAPAPFDDAWDRQRRWVFQTAAESAWWGTIMSEPGSGGDLARTRATARPARGASGYLLSGQKQFGSGSGVTAYMLTTARPDGGQEPDLFFLDVAGAPWDGTAGMTLVAEWDGHGMIATQSHGMRFDDYPAAQVAWPGHMADLVTATGGGIGCYFSAVIVGIVEAAIATARRQVARRRMTLRPYEQSEWARAELEGWLIQQAHEGMLRAIEEQGGAGDAVALGKTAIAELAEAALGRLCRVLGGGTYGGHTPFGWWFEDVRALGFLRPPWGLSYDAILEASWRMAEEGNSGG